VHSKFSYSSSLQSCEGIRTALDQLEPEKDVENFVNEYGTGNSISQPSDFVPSSVQGEPEMPGSPLMRAVSFIRVTRRQPQPALHNEAAIANNHIPQDPLGDTVSHTPSHSQSVIQSNHVNGDSNSYHDSNQDTISVAYTTSRSQSTAPAPPQSSPPNHPPPPVPDAQTLAAPVPVGSSVAGSSRSVSPALTNGRATASPNPNRASQPLPVTPHGGSSRPGRAQTPPPPLPESSSRILFYGEPPFLFFFLHLGTNLEVVLCWSIVCLPPTVAHFTCMSRLRKDANHALSFLFCS